jgi:hypothetical protein
MANDRRRVERMASVDDDESLAEYLQRRRREGQYALDVATGRLVETFAKRLYDSMILFPSVESRSGHPNSALGRPGRPRKEISAPRISELYWEMAEEEDELDPWKPTRPPTVKQLCERLSELGEPISENTLRRILREAAMPWPPPRLPDDDVIDEL